MSIIDIIILITYMIAILFMGTFIGKLNKKSNDYFDGGRSMPWYAIGLSVGMTMISANSFVGGPGWAYQEGIIAAMVNISIPISILFITYTILPVIYDAKVTTVYEYINLRLGVRSRILNVLAWLAQSLILVGGFVYTPSIVLAAITGVSMNIWVPVIMVFVIFYTVIGGIKAVIWTDALQGIILILGLVAGILVAIGKIGLPLNEIVENARQAGLMVSFDLQFQPGTLNIWCAMIGGLAMWIGYLGFDQGQVQRYITAKDMRTIKKTGIMSSIGMQLLYWMCFFLGIILFVFYQQYANTLDFTNANNVMIDFLINYCPSGLLGLLLAAVFAAAMSSISAVLNSLTTVFMKDIYEPYISKKENTSIKKNMLFSCIFGVAIIVFVYLYLGDNTASILATIAKYIAPFGSLLTGFMICCIFFSHTNDKGCFWGSLVSIACSFGIGQMFPDLHWLWAYVYGTFFCILFACIFSLFFKDPEARERAYPYTIYGTIARLKGKTDESGCSVEPLKMDVYGWIMIGIFVIQCAILYALQ